MFPQRLNNSHCVAGDHEVCSHVILVEDACSDERFTGLQITMNGCDKGNGMSPALLFPLSKEDS